MTPLITISLFLSLVTNSVYYSIFKSDYTDAVNFLIQNKAQIAKTCSLYKGDTAIITSVVFPELIRYSQFSDFFETEALELLYVKYGSIGADFSIGRFQMKPSFIEKMEACVKNSRDLKINYGLVISYSDSSDVKIRQARLERLKSLRWQLIYINCFYAIISERFDDLKWEIPGNKVRFYATAYNHGFERPADEIKKWVAEKNFPYGSNYTGNQYAYSDIAVDFYQNIYSAIFESKAGLNAKK